MNKPRNDLWKVQKHFSDGKVTVTPSERRSEGQDANAINGRGPRLRGKQAVYGGLLLDRSAAF